MAGDVKVVELEKRTLQQVSLETGQDLLGLLSQVGLFSSAQEEFWVLGLGADRDLHTATRISRGGWHATDVQLPAIFTAVLGCGATHFVIAHNHPALLGPTYWDQSLTRRVKGAASLLGLTFEDHVITRPNRTVVSVAHPAWTYPDRPVEDVRAERPTAGAPAVGMPAKDVLEAAHGLIVQSMGTQSLDIVPEKSGDQLVFPGEHIELAVRSSTGDERAFVVTLESTGRVALGFGASWGTGLFGPWPVAPTSAGRWLFESRSYWSAHLAAAVDEWLETSYGQRIQLLWVPAEQRLHHREHMHFVFKVQTGTREGLVEGWYEGSQDSQFRWREVHTWEAGELGTWPLDAAAVWDQFTLF